MGTSGLISRRFMKALGFAAGAALFLAPGFAAAQSDWPTWGHDPSRTGWNQSETTLTKDNVSRLELKWKSQLSTAPRPEVLSTLTAPLVATVASPQGPRDARVRGRQRQHRLRHRLGNRRSSWKKAFPNTLTPPKPATWLCPNTQNATPVIDKDAGIIYVSTSDGKLRGLSLANGEDRMPAVRLHRPFARNWSLNLIDGVIYSSNARGCGNAEAHLTAIDPKDPAHRVEFYTGTGRPSGVWGRGLGGSRAEGTLYADSRRPLRSGRRQFWRQRAVGDVQEFPSHGFLYADQLGLPREKDLDLGSANPLVFPFQKWTLVASAGKESTISLLDADNLGGADHHTPLYQSPRWGNDEVLLAGRGLWGAMATWQDGEGKRFVLMPLWGPPFERGAELQVLLRQRRPGQRDGF